jgi:hypothetical protein
MNMKRILFLLLLVLLIACGKATCMNEPDMMTIGKKIIPQETLDLGHSRLTYIGENIYWDNELSTRCKFTEDYIPTGNTYTLETRCYPTITVQRTSVAAFVCGVYVDEISVDGQLVLDTYTYKDKDQAGTLSFSKVTKTDSVTFQQAGCSSVGWPDNRIAVTTSDTVIDQAIFVQE